MVFNVNVVQPAAIKSPFHATGSARTAVGLFLLLVRRSGTHYQKTCGLRSVLWTVTDSHWRHFYFRSTSVFSALEVCYKNALYKFTIDVDIDIVSGTWHLRATQLLSEVLRYSVYVLLIDWQACDKVVKYVKSQLGVLRDGLDGKNVDVVLTEFGIRFHRVVYDHLLQFQFNSFGPWSRNIIAISLRNTSFFTQHC